MILVVDNYDSFTWTLVRYLETLGAATSLVRNDSHEIDELLATDVSGILISPGPGRPDQAGVSLGLVEACASKGLPLLGVCLGHQAIAQHFGARVARAPRPMHGKTSPIEHDGSGLFAGIPSPFEAARYHSLVVEAGSLPDCLRVTARAGDGTVQGLAHRSLPIHGVQFHPESVASGYGHALLANFLKLAESRAASPRSKDRLVA